ncbi:Protein tyrosine and serine/threonine kinase [Plasmodiophora brassicae]|uniref:non-specific serine/threonine protein kinase n=1 Tax=Plasmodiophora brassicae TaxID=37360 RepID=A0A3P3Y685_PLABS|nr:unnamed protein product [Plasmodiophora brassicae]
MSASGWGGGSLDIGADGDAEAPQLVRASYLHVLGSRSVADWKRRWVVLRSDFIVIFRGRPHEAATGNLPSSTPRSRSVNRSKSPSRVSVDVVASPLSTILAIITLRKAALDVTPSDSADGDSSFTITEGEHRFLFRTNDVVLFHGWVRDLTTVLETVSHSVSRSFRNRVGSSTEDPSGIMNGTASSMMPWQFEIPFEAIEFNDKLGMGHFGEVYRGSLWGTDIAIKQLKKQQVDEDILTSLKHEIAILSQLRHPNIVLYIGACTYQPNVCIVTEWCSGGTLYDLLHERSEPLNFGQILDMWTGIAQGLSYLHSLSRQIIHRDLKSQNVLVGGTLTPKVCDFGLSHVRQSLRKTSQEPQNGDGGHYGVFGTPEWMAPEIMEGSPYNASVDVYSFGIMMTEFLTRQLPFSDKYTVKGYRDIVTIVLDDGAIPTIPQWCGTFITSLIERCLHRNPQERPSFMEIIGHLRRLQSHRSSFFTEFDVPRMLDMILSTDRVTAALAARELASLSPGEVEKIPLETVNVFVARLSILMGPDHSEVVYASALLTLIRDHPSHARHVFRTMLLENGGVVSLLQMVSQPTSSFSRRTGIDILNLILNGVPVKSQAKYVDVDLASSTVPNGLFVFKDIIEETLSALEKARRQVEVDILQQQALMQRVSVCCTIMQSEKKKLEKIKGGDPPNVDREVRSHVRSARSASTNNEPPLLAAYRDPDAFTVVSQIPDTKLLGATFVGHFGTFQPTLHDNAVMLGPDGIWCDVFLFMFGTDIRVYDMFDATDPDDCVLIINTIDQTSGEIVAVSNASPFSHQPHCIAIAGSSDDSEMFRFAFRTRMKALRWAHRISPRLHDPAPSEHIVLAQKRKRKQYLRRVRRRHFMRSHIAFSSKDQLRDLVDGEGSDDQHHGVAGQYLLHIGVDDAVGRDLEDPPSAFVDYFGSLLRSKHGFALRWMDQANTTPVRSTFTGRVIPAAGGLWILVFLYLHGDVIRVYDSIQDEPDDPLACIYLTALDRFGEENPVSIAVGARHGRPHCIEIEEQTVFAFRSRSTALQWAELVNSVKSI